MKTLLLSFLFSFFFASSFAQKITGKWDCDKEVMQALRIDYKEVYCTYKFKKNGTLIIKIDGETMINHSSNTIHKKVGTVRIKGKYKLDNGRITSFVNEKGVEAAALVILDDKYLFEGRDALATYINNVYSSQKKYANTMEHKLLSKLKEHRYLWDWNNEPITITKKELIIGDKLRCKR